MNAPAPQDTFTVTLDGQAVEARPGETVVQVAERNGVSIPTLCHDSRLAPAGACRICLVEVEGQRRLQPGCAWRVTSGMKITTKSDRITRHQQMLLALYLSDHALDDQGLPERTIRGNRLRVLAEEIAPPRLEAVEAPRHGRDHDVNPYIRFDADKCILCARCTRYCDEVEAVNAITLSGRGATTTIGTAGMRGLLDTSCELCGGCVDTCPTGALSEKKVPLTVLDQKVDLVRTTCNYCGVGCQMDLNV
ncbi:MAG: (2Fe-2S)-binding protein, partial [Myxococcales bacterium]|nr:(2Fe-2S)-binding protein [Myxococcales bacterium]